jgi:2-amino-4-hydroxy-6-hydroxymethyldihydropteridine diphosphokinase
MPIVYLGIGSNLQPEQNMRLAVRELRNRFSLKKTSPVYRNNPYGFSGEPFLNAVVCVETDLNPRQVCRQLDEIHALAGRVRDAQRFCSRTLDVDLLLYDDLIIDEKPVSVPRSDVLQYSFVLKPLADIAPQLRHPVTGKTMSWHWQEFDSNRHPLTETAASL